MAAKDTEDRKPDDQDPETSLDMSQAAVKKMIAEAREKGYITYDQLNQVLPPDQVSSEQIEDVMSMLSEMGINIIEDEEAEEEDQKSGSTAVVQAEHQKREVDLGRRPRNPGNARPDRRPGAHVPARDGFSVELLSREGEIAIAKRIEAGRNTMIAGLCESPLTFQAITIWRDELLSEDILAARCHRSRSHLSATRWTKMTMTEEPVVDGRQTCCQQPLRPRKGRARAGC